MNTRSTVLVCGLSLLLTACQGEEVNDAAVEEERTMPPGFLDEPPPPPTSDNLILSGGTVVIGEERIDDAVVVLSAGELVAWGKRGGVDVPNDSIGHDMRGKWIVAGNRDDLERGELPNPTRWVTGGEAAFLIFDAPQQWQDPIGLFHAGMLTLPPPEED